MAFIGNQIITINSLLDLDGQELVLDADADSTIHVSTDDQIDFKIGGTDVATFTNSSSDFVITQAVQDKDIIFKGDDGGSAITALTLDMSEAGNASFNGTVTAAGGSSNNNDDANILTLNATQHARLLVDTASTSGHRASLVLESNGQETTLGTTGSASELAVPTGDLTLDVDGNIILNADGAVWKFEDGSVEIFQITSGSQNANLISMVQDKDIRLQGYDGSSLITALNLDMSDAGHATFNNGITLSDGDLNVASGHGISFGQTTTSVSGASADTTTLREYERGTWTPACSSLTIANAFGDYIKIDKLVFIQGRFTRNTTSADSTNVEITGLPFSTDPVSGGAHINGAFWLDIGANTTDTTGSVYVTTTPALLFVKSTNPSNQAPSRYVIENDITNGRGINFSAVYQTS